MPAFSHLPNETLTDIFSYLPAADRARTTCVSRHLYDIVRPLLYEAPYLPRCRDSLDSPVFWPSRELFLRTLLSPNGAVLAARVRSLHVEWDGTESGRADDCLSESHSVRSAIAARIGLHYPIETQGAQLLIILDLLPHLRMLQLIPAPGSPTSSEFSFVRFLERPRLPNTIPLGLQSLQNFHVTRLIGTGFNGVSGWTMLMLLKLPNIQTINLPSFTRGKITMVVLHGEAPRSTVTKLRFSSATMPSWALSFILRAPTALTHFSYSTASAKFNLVGFMNALAPLRTSLRSLHLDLHGACMDVVKKDGLAAPYSAGSLREWTVLKTLRCGLMPLLGADTWVNSLRLVDVLPISIRELQILPNPYWSETERIGQMEELLQRRWEQVPVLASVVVVSVVRGELWWMEELEPAADV